MAKDKLLNIEKRKTCLDRVRQLQELINDPSTLDAFSPTMWETLDDHLQEDIRFVESCKEYKSKFKPA